jgi:hypothetical protein
MNHITRRGGALKVVIIIAVIFVLLVVLFLGGIAGLAVFGISKIDDAIKLGIEKGGTYALGVPVTVRQVDLAITKGTFAMEGFNVANPQGYDTAHFVDLGAGNLAVDYASMQAGTIDLPVLHLSAIDLNLEKKSGKANYQVILDNLEKFESTGSSSTSSSSDDGFEFVIQEIIIKDVTVHADVLPVGGELTRANAHIDEIVLENVGTAGDPVDMAQLIAIVTQAILESVAKGVAGLPGDIAGELTSGLGDLTGLGDMGIDVAADISGQIIGISGNLGEEATHALDGLESAAEDIGKGLEDAASGIGNLFGGDDDDDDDEEDDK